MSRTVNEIRTLYRGSAEVSGSPMDRPIRWRWWGATITAGLLSLVALVLAGVGAVDAYRARTAAHLAAERRADAAEGQLDTMLKAGDGGILVGRVTGRVVVIDVETGRTLANLDAREIGPAEVRVRPWREGRR